MKCLINNNFKPGIDYNVSELCRQCGISRMAFYKIINDQVVPRLDTALKICAFFNRTDNRKPDWTLVDMEWTIYDLWKE